MKPASMFPRRHSLIRIRREQRGIALLEVLIAFFVLSIGLLGLAGMQMRALQFNQASSQRSQAIILAYDMMDRLRINQEQAVGNNYNITWRSSGSGSGIIGNDLTEWLQNVNGNLPEGEGSIDCDANDICTVSVRWRDRFGENPGADWETLAISSQM
jgi:type IV pilus assembly protein PilV